jgi:hypothetical protein
MLCIGVHRAFLVPVVLWGLVLVGCSGGGSTAPPTPDPLPSPIHVTTNSLPDGQVGQSYTATLAATGGKAPLSWQVNSGALPLGLALASSGLLSGTPSEAAAARSITFGVSDSSSTAQTETVTLKLTVAPLSPPPPPALTVTTTSLPNGQVNHAYSATLSASGGTAPLSWKVSSGALPAGLTLASNGAISGTPTAAAAATPITFTVSDSSATAQTKDVTLGVAVSPEGITVSLSPARAAVVVTQSLALTATTTDYAGVSWSISPTGSGAFSAPSSASGAAVTLTAPSTAGVYTVTATSVTDGSQSASISVAVTDLGGVYTYHNDLARDGANTQEYALTPKNVNSASFGKLFSCPVDGAVYAQPLWVANLTIGGSRHNVVLVATMHDSVYAFDADASPCVQLWGVSLIDIAHGANAGELSVASSPTNWLVGLGEGDTSPEVGITGTPVIDPASGTLYVVSMSTNPAGTSFYQRLHAIDITSGSEKTGSPVLITGTYPGTGSGGTRVAFDPHQERQRTGLALVNGVVYIAWASFEDFGPWYGWIMGYTYNGHGFVQSSVLNVSPNTRAAGIWMSGGAPAADSNGNIYISTGNGPADPMATTGPNNDYGDSVLKLSGALTVSDWFLPSAYATLSSNDLDLGAGGAAVVVSPPSGPIQHVVITGGKDGTLYLLNGDKLGGLGDANAVQYFLIGTGGAHPIFATPAFWNNTLFIAPISQPLLAYAFDTSLDKLNPATPTAQSPTPYAFPGATPSVSASGSTNGIVWAINSNSYCTAQARSCGPAVLHAYDATNLAHELWNSATIPADAAGNAVKFTVPTVANGKVYVGTRGNNTGGVYGSTTIAGEVDVYGLNSN